MASISISCVENRDRYIHAASTAVERTARCVGVDCVYWFSNQPFPREIPGVELINILISERFDEFFSDINRLYLKVMPRVVTTDFNIVVQWDGFAVNAESWDDEFLKYDYIGACWLWPWGGDSHRRGPIVGNGGFSLRSRRLLDALLQLDPKWDVEHWVLDNRFDLREYYVISADGQRYLPEDLLICLWYRETLEKEFGIRFCPPELANKFSVESGGSFTESWLGRSFGFHSAWAASYYGVALRA